MEPKYIFAIVVLSIFLVLFLVFFVMLAHKRKMEAKLQAWLAEVYDNSNIAKFDYNTAEDSSADNTEQPVREVPVSEVGEDFADTQPKEEDGNDDPATAFGDLEEVEEIKGNYNPE